MKIYGIKYADGDVIRAKGAIRIGELDPFSIVVLEIYMYMEMRRFLM